MTQTGTTAPADLLIRCENVGIRRRWHCENLIINVGPRGVDSLGRPRMLTCWTCRERTRMFIEQARDAFQAANPDREMPTYPWEAQA